MPKGHQSPGILVAEIEMTRAQQHGSILIVEGPDDTRFWRRRVHAECELVEGYGKKNVVLCMERLDGKGVRGVLGIVDSDYEAISGNSLPSTNLASTDAHDLECMLCRSSALLSVLSELADAAKVQRFEAEVGHDVRTALLQRALILGRLRWAAVYFGFEINSINVHDHRFIDEANWAVNEQAILKFAAKAPESAEELSSKISRLPSADPWHVATGNDMVQLLRLGLKRKLGCLLNQIGSKEIARLLRAAMPVSELKATGLGREVLEWESNNSSYRIFEESSD